MSYKRKFFILLFLSIFLGISINAQIRIDAVEGSTSIKLKRQNGRNMLNEIKSVIKERYYDKNFRGIDLNARFKIAEERIKTQDTNWQIFRTIAQVVTEFNDSHTRFYPPGRANRVEYGFSTQMIGNNCFVVDVKKGSDAEVKGLKAGDLITGIGNFAPTRDNLWKMNYILYALDPQASVKLYIQNPGQAEREIEVKSKFKSIKEREKEAEKNRKQKVENPYKCQQANADVIACRLETFSIDKKFIDQMMKEANNYKKLVLDLRGNGGGYVKIEEYLTGHFFDRDVKIGDFITRGKTREVIAKTQKKKVFNGELVVLIDSNSASASEVFARVIQIEKRGKIVGDVSAGAVMTSNYISMANTRGVPGYETLSFFALNVTVADLVMSDGNRLENVGVIPDYPIGPAAAAIFQATDPVLAYSVRMLGANMTEEAAGKLHFLAKRAEDEDDEPVVDDGDN